MKTFSFSTSALTPDSYRRALEDPAAGGYASFEGWVRNHNEGHAVTRLEYEAFEALAVVEGTRIVDEAIARFGVIDARCVHRVGSLGIGDLAVWVGVSSRHRAEAFAACRFIIDEVKHRVPIWKKEHYVTGDSGWVNCERCAEAASPKEALPSTTCTHEHFPTLAHASRLTPHASHLTPHASPDYSRQISLRDVGAAGQAKLRSARVLVIGAGGLGVPALNYLAGAGVGTIGIAEADVLDASNLHRQPLYALEDVGKPKSALAAARLQALNPDVHIATHERITSLLRYAKRCGVSASLSGLMSGAAAGLLGNVGPDTIIDALAAEDVGDAQPHYFSFGGVIDTAHYAVAKSKEAAAFATASAS
jgi:adenylyltransferase/sulfurtransferase